MKVNTPLMPRALLPIYLDAFDDFSGITDELKLKAIEEYKAALKMPRKKKKQAKKSAMLLYAIACWGQETFKN